MELKNCFNCENCYYLDNNFHRPRCHAGYWVVSDSNKCPDEWVVKRDDGNVCEHFQYSLLYQLVEADKKDLLKK